MYCCSVRLSFGKQECLCSIGEKKPQRVMLCGFFNCFRKTKIVNWCGGTPKYPAKQWFWRAIVKRYPHWYPQKYFWWGIFNMPARAFPSFHYQPTANRFQDGVTAYEFRDAVIRECDLQITQKNDVSRAAIFFQAPHNATKQHWNWHFWVENRTKKQLNYLILNINAVSQRV